MSVRTTRTSTIFREAPLGTVPSFLLVEVVKAYSTAGLSLEPVFTTPDTGLEAEALGGVTMFSIMLAASLSSWPI